METKIWTVQRKRGNKMYLMPVNGDCEVIESYTLLTLNPAQYLALYKSANWKLCDGTADVLETTYTKDSEVLKLFNDLARTKRIVPVNKRFDTDVKGTSKLVRNAEKTVIYIVRRNGIDKTSINSVCINDLQRTAFFEDVKTARASMFCDKYCLTPQDKPMFAMWDKIMNAEYFKQLRRYESKVKK